MQSPAIPSPGIADEFNRWARYAQTVLKARGVAIGLLEADVLRCIATSGRFVPGTGHEFRTDGLAWTCVAKDVALNSSDVAADPHTAAEECVGWGARSVVLAPIHDAEVPRGVLVVISDAPNAFSDFAIGTAERLAHEMSAMLALFWNETAPAPAPELISPVGEPAEPSESQPQPSAANELAPQPPVFLSQSSTLMVHATRSPEEGPSMAGDHSASEDYRSEQQAPPAAAAQRTEPPAISSARARPQIVSREPDLRAAAPRRAAADAGTPSWYPEPDYSAYSAPGRAGGETAESSVPPRPHRPPAKPVQKPNQSPDEDDLPGRGKIWAMRIFLVVWILVAGATTWRLRDAMWAYLVGSTPPSAEAAATDSPTEETKAVTRRRAKAKESLVPQPRESASSQHAPATPANPSRAGFAATPSRLLLRVEPTYPASARALHISSTVVLEAQILKDGSVGNIKFVSGDTAFREAALDAVRQWKYQPATLDGVPMQSTAVIDLQFSP